MDVRGCVFTISMQLLEKNRPEMYTTLSVIMYLDTVNSL
jgi:hypothetical protein